MLIIDLLHLIERLEEQIGQARRLPIGTGSVVDRRRLLDRVDQLRAAVPAQVREAQELLESKEEVLARTDEEVALRLSRADEEVARRVGESEVAKAAEARAEQIIAEAQSEVERQLEEGRKQVEAKIAEGERLASEQMDEADRYAMEMLRKLEQQLDAFMVSVRSGIEALERKPEGASAPGGEAPEETTEPPRRPGGTGGSAPGRRRGGRGAGVPVRTPDGSSRPHD